MNDRETWMREARAVLDLLEQCRGPGSDVDDYQLVVWTARTYLRGLLEREGRGGTP